MLMKNELKQMSLATPVNFKNKTDVAKAKPVKIKQKTKTVTSVEFVRDDIKKLITSNIFTNYYVPKIVAISNEIKGITNDHYYMLL